MATKKKARRKHAPSRPKPKDTNKEDTCFIIMPFGEWFDTYYESIYLPAIEETGLKPRRADNLYRPSAIINDIWALTNEAKLILADLSEKNPNVFYELGIAHALAKPAILVTESMEDVPFDLRSLRVIVYEKSRPDWGDVLREKIQLAIKEVLASPLDAVLPTFIKIKESSTPPTASKIEKEMISLRQDVDRLTREFRFAAFGGLETARMSPSASMSPSVALAHMSDRRTIDPKAFLRLIAVAREQLESGKTKLDVVRDVRRRFGLSAEEALLVMRQASSLIAAKEPKPSETTNAETENSEPTPAKD